MRIELTAQVARVTAKPPKVKEGIVLQGPTMQVVLEIEGVQQIASLARFLGQAVDVSLESLQLAFDDVAPDVRRAARDVMAPATGTTTEIRVARTG